jgi:DNA repair exonuclease SbcCD ATPase subunit
MKTVQHALLAASLAGALLAAAGPASAQSMEDKLRSQLRETVQQLRQLQDNQAQLESAKSAAEQARDKALADLKHAQDELAAAKGESSGESTAKHALAQEKVAHEQDARQLAKYKSSYEDLAATSRARDTERTQLQAAIRTRDTQLQKCEAKNADLYQVGHEILDAYQHVGLGTLIETREPFAQGERVKYDEIAQRYGDALYGAKYDPDARPAAASPTAAAVGAVGAAGAQ